MKHAITLDLSEMSLEFTHLSAIFLRPIIWKIFASCLMQSSERLFREPFPEVTAKCLQNRNLSKSNLNFQFQPSRLLLM